MPRYLVIQLARFGDVLQSARLIRTLIQRGETHLCVDHSLAGLAAVVYPQVIVHPIKAHAEPGDDAATVLESSWRAVTECAALTFTGVYNLNYSGLNRALARLFDPTIVHGYGSWNGQALRARWLDLAFRWTQHRRSAPLNLVDVWAGLLDDPLPPEACHPPAMAGGRGLGVVLAGRQSRRSLPPDVLGPCVHALFEALGGPDVWLFGSEAERPLARQLLRHLPARVLDRVHDLAGRTSLLDLRDALIGLDAVLTPDTGIMHLAASVGAPVQALFLSSAWAWETGPYGLGHTVWQAWAECAPCLETAACGYDVKCLAPFRTPSFLNALAGRHAATPDGLWRMTSDLDPLGLVWSMAAGTDSEAARRGAQRALLAEYRGKGQAKGALHELARTFYQEADWMLPDPLP